MEKLNSTKVILCFFLLLNSVVFSQYMPQNREKLLFIGQDLTSVANYRKNCIGCPKGHGETTYLSFYLLNTPYVYTPHGGIHYGAIGMDNEGKPVEASTDWGGGPLNLWKVASRSSLVSVGLDMSTGVEKEGLTTIAKGGHDAIIQKMAVLFNAFPETVFFLRIGYEFDGNWYPGYDNTTNYISAYRRIVDVLRQHLQQDNVKYVWQSSGAPVDDAIEEGKRENIMDWYPGDDYVDWTAISWFLCIDEKATITSKDLKRIPTQRQLAREMLYHSELLNKPMMIAEATPQGYSIAALTNCHVGDIWDGTSGQECIDKTPEEIYAEWFEPIFQFMRENSEVQALAYINANWNTQGLWGSPYHSGYWGDSRIEKNEYIRNKWIASVAESGFLSTMDPTQIKAIAKQQNNMLTSTETQLTATKKKTTLINLRFNPVGDFLYIDGADTKDTYQIIDMKGKTVLQGVGAKVDVSSLSMGMFMIGINDEKIKFIKQ